MVTSLDPSGRWETQAQIDSCLSETGVTKEQVVRWRRLGLLSEDVEQDSDYHRSVIRFPAGTCAQIKAAKALFEEKNRVSYVGLRLWRRGCPVDEKYWRPRLKLLGLADRLFSILQWLQTRYDRDDEGCTLSERTAQRPMRNIIMSRVVGRLKGEDLAIVLRVLIDVGMGQFEGFEPPVTGEGRTRDERATWRRWRRSRLIRLKQTLPIGTRMSQMGGDRAYMGQIGNGRFRDESRHPIASAK
jgi:hypothetical protein